MLSNVRGTFSGVKGTVVYDPADPSATQVDAVVDAATISTGDPKRDDHLKSADFLDVAKYPAIAFRSKRTEKTGDAEFKVTGDLTIHGTRARPPSALRMSHRKRKIPGAARASAPPPRPKSTANNSELPGTRLLESGGVIVGDEVKLEFDLEFTKVEAAGA